MVYRCANIELAGAERCTAIEQRLRQKEYEDGIKVCNACVWATWEALHAENAQLKEENAELSQQNNTDSLTGLGNERLFVAKIQEWDELKIPFAVAQFDVRNLKAVNEQHGLSYGDFVLKATARALRSRRFSLTDRQALTINGGDDTQPIVEEDMSFRLGGGADEFAVLLMNPLRNPDSDLTARQRAIGGGLYFVEQIVGSREYRQHNADSGNNSCQLGIKMGISVHEPGMTPADHRLASDPKLHQVQTIND